MPSNKSQWLHTKRRFEGEKPGNALVKWLNQPHLGPKFVEDLLQDAQAVFHWVAKYESLRALNVARKQKKLPMTFWECHHRLNDTLATFTHAPQIDLHELPDGEKVSWMSVTDESPVALFSVQVKCVLRLIEQGAILKIRKCQQCTKWFFARFLHQEFCTAKCRTKHLASSEKFKEKRRKYMRDYHRLQKSKNVK